MFGWIALLSCASVTLILFAGGGSEVVLLVAAVARGGVIVGGVDGGDGIIGAGGEGVVGGALMITFFIKRGSGDLLSTMSLRKDSGTS